MRWPEDGDAAAHARRLRRRLYGLAGALLALLALTLAWRWTPMQDWLEVQRIVGALRQLGQSFGVPAAVLGFALAVATAVPLTFLTLVAMVAFGPWIGLACAMPGALIGAALSYAAGRALGREAVLRLAGAKVNAVSERLGRRGLLAVIAVRLLPIAPFPIVNMVAGATQISLRDLLLGTALGMSPSTVFMMVFVDRIIAALQAPSAFGAGLLAGTLVLLAVGGWAVRRWLRRPAS